MVRIELTEEMILNYRALPKELDGWRHYRIEYWADDRAYDIHERTILLPPKMDADRLERYLDRMIRRAQRDPKEAKKRRRG